jgi:hypothetical protein
MSSTNIVTEFCGKQSDDLYSAGTRKRKSILLQIKDDIDYNLGIHKAFRNLDLTQEQERVLGNEIAPLFVVPLLYCSAVDLMARIKYKSSPAGRNAALFKESAVLFFDYTPEQADVLWKFRNSITHQYSIRKYIISRYGGRDGVLDISNDRVVVSVRPMRSSLSNAVQKLHEFLLAESNEDKGLTANFIDKHGFTYYLVV